MRRYFIKEQGREEIEVSLEQWNTKRIMLGITSITNSFETSTVRGRVEECDNTCIAGPVQYFNALNEEEYDKREARWNLIWQIILGVVMTGLVALWVVITHIASVSNSSLR